MTLTLKSFDDIYRDAQRIFVDAIRAGHKHPVEATIFALSDEVDRCLNEADPHQADVYEDVIAFLEKGLRG